VRTQTDVLTKYYVHDTTTVTEDIENTVEEILQANTAYYIFK
jgi:hypothetical protein